MFDDVPYIKKSFPRLHKCHFNIVGKCPFFQRSKPMIFVNNLKVHLSLIFFEKDLDMMFDNVLNEKKKLSWLQKRHFNIVGQCPFLQRG